TNARLDHNLVAVHDLVDRNFLLCATLNYNRCFCLEIEQFFDGVAGLYFCFRLKVFTERDKGDHYDRHVVISMIHVQKWPEYFFECSDNKTVKKCGRGTDTD